MEMTERFLNCAIQLLQQIEIPAVEKVVDVLANVRKDGGRLFLVGSGGGAGHASHATCDFRKLCGMEAYCATDNVSELTARINDEGWETSYSNYLKASRLNSTDCLLVFSVGGGNHEKRISENLVSAVREAKTVGAKIVGIVGRDGGYTAQEASACVIIPTSSKEWVTPLTEGLQAVIWHLLVSHPKLRMNEAKWESTR